MLWKKITFSFLFIGILVTVYTGMIKLSALPRYKVYFGDLHNHTSYSDGKSTPQKAFSQVKERKVADFMAITDHNYLLGDKEWEDIKSQADKYTDDTFVGISGYEYTTLWGHINVFNTNLYEKNSLLGMEKFYTKITEDKNALLQWNHPTQYSDDFKNYNGYTTERDQHFRLIEVYNNDNNFESSFIKALDAGWHVLPTATSDHHGTNWMEETENRTAVMTSQLTRKEIFNAIRTGKVYATSDKNLTINFSINANDMGSILNNASNFSFSITANDPDANEPNNKIKKIEIISNKGDIVFSKDFDSHDVNLLCELESKTSKYYFARVTNVKGRRACTSPIWINRF